MASVKEICEKVKTASYELAGYSAEQKSSMLSAVAKAFEDEHNIAAVKAANKIDISAAENSGKDETFIDRLTLTDARIASMTDGLKAVISLDDPVGEIVESRTRADGLLIERVRAPLGVVGIIYEARPNVTVDAAALCVKSGNGVVLRGSKDAVNSNRALYEVMAKAAAEAGFNADALGFIDDVSREASREMLLQERYIDVLIPRGGEGLKHFVLENAKMPVIASAGGNCHIYVEKSANQDMAVKIIVNAKLQRPSVCNAAEHLIVDKEIAAEFLPKAYNALKAAHDIKIVGDTRARAALPQICEMSEEDYSTEFLGYEMSFAVADGTKQAVDMINRFSTKHSEAIISENEAAQRYFASRVDAAAVYINASTRFTDGYEFGLGAEMGISTQKLHARGPIALKELTSVKYVVRGCGQIRNS
jgi:glutamate-5-semialdehyde dehydrogenase